MKKMLYLKLLVSAVRELTRSKEKIEERREKLGNIIGDVLVLLEQEAIGTSEDFFVKRRITALIDVYAEEFDEILKKHRVGTISEIKKLMTSLLDDLEKITNSEEVELTQN